MFAHMIEENNLMKVFQEYGLDQQDVTFIKELISGPLCSNSEIEVSLFLLIFDMDDSFSFMMEMSEIQLSTCTF